MSTAVRLYGLTVRSEIPLHQARFVDEPADLEITVGSTMPATYAEPAGRILLSLRAHHQYYTATATPTGYQLRFFGTCDVFVSQDLSRATVHPVRGVDPDLISVLLAGTFLAFVLAVRGEAVLHASAVETTGGALAFVGASGMGKSTMATLLCAAGARLITDDLLRLHLTADGPRCVAGAAELRLRKNSAELVSRFGRGACFRRTADDRDALAVAVSQTEDPILGAIVVPLPDRSVERTQMLVERIDRKAAVLLLSRFPRLLGWQDKAVLARRFQQLGEIVDRTPVFLAALPWGPPFRPDIAEEVLRAIGMTGRAEAPATGQSDPVSASRSHVA